MTNKKITCFVVAAVMTFFSGVAAMAQEVIPGGQPLGIRMSLNGVMVEGTGKVKTASGDRAPAADAGIQKGDIVTKIGSEKIENAQDLNKAVKNLKGGKISVTVDRQGKTKQFNVTPVKDLDGAWKMGMWLRDGISGIGTLTFYDPETGVYGALGHSISDSETGAVLPLRDGKVYDAEVTGIKRGETGSPGALNGCTDEAEVLGDIQINCGCGIFGEGEFSGDAIETGDMKEGKATVYCTLNGDKTAEYTIEIKRVFETDGMTASVITVTDPELLERTGGIVQGMSGSPIIQDGRLVGAVTHVFVNDPTSGYGLSIYDMLNAADACDKAA